ncbi:hypothetical protein LU11_gp009 [Pseudomonas phage Lu11]|uniref:hypothetical protein n=1 Tax=Pseudomonas phage Lu11 TaxID=1161927 RepID=UPI00025F14E3|nr:hypothetical protein LU11_gp009 [Pseudomonas phage Lu11]AFH14540.1 hypothetical protein Lu11_0009 [Pseudomonas phage Lu11]
MQNEKAVSEVNAIHETELGAVFLDESGVMQHPFTFTTHAKMLHGGFVTIRANSLIDLRTAFDRFHPEIEFKHEYDQNTRALFLMRSGRRIESWIAERDVSDQCHGIMAARTRLNADFEIEDLHGKVERLSMRAHR